MYSGKSALISCLIMLSACATKTRPSSYLFYHRPPAPEVRAQLGRVTIVPEMEPIVVKAQRPQGLRENVRDATHAVIHVADQHGLREIHELHDKVQAWAYALPVLVLSGGAAGAVMSVPRATSGESKVILTKAVDQMDLQHEWARQVQRACQERAPSVSVGLADDKGGNRPTDGSLLELHVAKLALIGDQSANPPLTLHLWMEARLRKVGRDEPLYECEFEYTGGQGYRLADWAKADAALLRAEIPRVFPRIADRAVEIIFTDEPIALDNLYSEIPD